MKLGNFRRRITEGGERGYILLTLVLFSVLMLIALAAEAPSVAGQARHEREDELIHRGVQYARAIKRYYKKFGSYPVSLEQLDETNKMRFLRRRYQDPMTGKAFRLLHYGDPNLPSMINAAAPALAGATPVGNFGSTSAGGTSPATSTTSPFSSPFRSSGSSGPSGSAGTSFSSSGSPGSASTSSSGSGGDSSPSSAAGATVGGGAILGVASTSDKDGFHEFNKKRRYNQWAFIFDPTANQKDMITGPYNGPPAFTPVSNPITILSPVRPGGTGQPGSGPGGPGGGKSDNQGSRPNR